MSPCASNCEEHVAVTSVDLEKVHVHVYS
jgi:hypothetical protein